MDIFFDQAFFSPENLEQSFDFPQLVVLLFWSSNNLKNERGNDLTNFQFFWERRSTGLLDKHPLRLQEYFSGYSRIPDADMMVCFVDPLILGTILQQFSEDFWGTHTFII